MRRDDTHRRGWLPFISPATASPNPPEPKRIPGTPPKEPEIPGEPIPEQPRVPGDPPKPQPAPPFEPPPTKEPAKTPSTNPPQLDADSSGTR